MFIVVGLAFRGKVGVRRGFRSLCRVAAPSVLKEVLLQPVVPLEGLQLLNFQRLRGRAVILHDRSLPDVDADRTPDIAWASIPVTGSMNPTSKFAQVRLTPYSTHVVGAERTVCKLVVYIGATCPGVRCTHPLAAGRQNRSSAQPTWCSLGRARRRREAGGRRQERRTIPPARTRLQLPHLGLLFRRA